jgi:hypothetical protein
MHARAALHQPGRAYQQQREDHSDHEAAERSKDELLTGSQPRARLIGYDRDRHDHGEACQHPEQPAGQWASMRLQVAQGGEQPVMIRFDAKAGHVMGSSSRCP